jgi:hypothetical protein
MGRVGLVGSRKPDRHHGNPGFSNDQANPRLEVLKRTIDRPFSFGEDTQGPARTEKVESDSEARKGLGRLDRDNPEEVAKGFERAVEEGGESPEKGPGQHLWGQTKRQDQAVKIA